MFAVIGNNAYTLHRGKVGFRLEKQTKSEGKAHEDSHGCRNAAT